MSATGLKAVFLAERPMLLRLLRARLKEADAAEDVLQDVWLKLEALPSGPVADPAAYLFRMANNLALDRRRSDARRQSREGAWLELRGDTEDAPSAETALIARDKLGRIQAAIGTLPERTARIFRRYRFDGVPRRDIAAEEGISVSATEKHLQRAYALIERAREENGVDSDTL